MQLDQNDLADLVAETIIDAVKPLQKQVEALRGHIETLETSLRQAEATRTELAPQVTISVPETLAAVLEEVAPQIKEAVAEALAALPAPKDGKDADPAAIAHAVEAAIAALPKPQDGRSVTLEEIVPLVNESVKNAVAALPAPKDGTSVVLGDVIPELTKQVAAQVTKWLQATPLPKDGKSVTVDDVIPTIESMFAAWALQWERSANDRWERAIDRMPAPKNGTDGKDGLGFDDMTFEQIDERSGVLRFTRGTAVKEFPIALAGFVDRGLWQEGEFVKGDGVTWEGNYWLARRDTKAKPGAEGEDTGNNDWRLAVRKGRKGKDGDRGRDLRSVTAKLTP
jgi:hypothetical protein